MEDTVPEEIKKKYDQLSELYQLRKKLRKSNLEALKNYEKIDFSTRICKLDKIQKMCNKIKQLEPTYREQLLKEVDTINLSKFVQEISHSISEYALLSKDIVFCMELCSKLHQSYQDFANYFVADIKRCIVDGGNLPESLSRAKRRKNQIRLLGELFIIGLPISYDDLHQCLQIATYSKDINYFEENLIVAEEFASNFNIELFGKASLRLNQDYIQYTSLPVLDFIEEAITVDKQQTLNVWFESYISRAIDIVSKHFNKYAQQERKIFSQKAEGGKVHQNQEQLWQELREKYYGVKSIVVNIMQSIGKYPDIDFEIELQDINYKKEVVVKVEASNKKQQAPKTEESKKDDNQQFGDKHELYEVFVNLKQLVPAILLENKDNQLDEKQFKIISSSKHDYFIKNYEQCFQQLEKCNSIESSDALAEQFCYINSKENREKLLDDIAEKFHSKPQLYPYLCRFVATLSEYFNDIFDIINEVLLRKYEQLTQQQQSLNQINQKLDSLLILICEYTKFRVIDTQILLNIFKQLGDDININNFQYLIHIIQNCGRFLLTEKESKIRFQTILTFVIKNKQGKNIPQQLEDDFTKYLKEAKPKR